MLEMLKPSRSLIEDRRLQVTDSKDGERGRNRTYNLLIKSQLLCQLSYAPRIRQTILPSALMKEIICRRRETRGGGDPPRPSLTKSQCGSGEGCARTRSNTSVTGLGLEARIILMTIPHALSGRAT